MKKKPGFNDTIQGTDMVNVRRNESGGVSGVLLDNPELITVFIHK
jgi:hypothetical protein